MTGTSLHRAACLCAACFLLLIAAPTICLGAPQRVTLYPQSALVRGEATLPPAESGRVVLNLPIHAREDSWRFEVLQPAGAAISDVLTQKVRRVDSKTVQELQARLEELRSRKTDCANRKRAAGASADFWLAQSQAEPEDVEQIERLAGMIRSNLNNLFAEEAALEDDIQKLKEQIADLEARLDELTGQARQEWRISLSLQQAEGEQITIGYEYQADNCGWSPVYRLNALPADSEVDFTWQAKVWQETGRPWRQAVLELATVRDRQRIEPPQLRDWIIRPRPPVEARQAQDKAMSLAGARPQAEAAASVQRRRGYLFDTYELGRLSLASGERKRLTIRHKRYPAEFDYLVRAHRSDQAFLRARIERADDLHFPEGQAMYLLESAFLDKRSFSMFSPSKPLFFGQDPHLEVSFETMDEKSGQKGLFGKKKSYAWFWKVRVTNNKTRPVSVRLEDAAPQIRDERIELTRHFPGPEPTMEDHTAVWELTIPAGGTESLEYGYSLEYPEDMNLFMGGR
jgi:uncharacterized protein (TIGR02231 family)